MGRGSRKARKNRNKKPTNNRKSMARPKNRRPWIEEVASGRYQVLGALGKGGQGTVFRASDTAREGAAVVAVKTIATSINETTRQTWERARREIEIHKSLGGKPNIMPVLDVGDEELITRGEKYQLGYIVMPLAAHSLHDLIDAFHGRLELALEVIQGIVTAVIAAHSHDPPIVHRDIKPRNVLFLQHGLRDPRLSDFGICHITDLAAEDRLTTVHETVGARNFMAPEQNQKGPQPITPAADIYSLGKVLVSMLTGAYVHREYYERAFDDEAQKKDPRINLLCERVLSRCIAEEPESRLQNAMEMHDCISEFEHSIRHGSFG